MKQTSFALVGKIFPFDGTKLSIFLHTYIIINTQFLENGPNGLKNGLNGLKNGLKWAVKRTGICEASLYKMCYLCNK